MTQLAQLDENTVPGQTYTFQFKLNNYIEVPRNTTIQQDLVQNAPNFVQQSLQVTSPSSVTNPLGLTYNIQFTYGGDGSDVISDVANELIASVSAGSSDTFIFVGAAAADAQTLNDSGGISDTINQAIDKINQIASNATKSASDVLNQATTGVTKTAAQSAQNLLTPVEIAIGLVVVFIIAIIFTSGKAGGIAAGPTGVDIGGK